MFDLDPPDDESPAAHGDEEPDSERTQRADYDLDRQRDEALIDRLREERRRLEALLAEDLAPDSEVPF